MIQFIHKQGAIFCMNIHGTPCQLAKAELYTDGLLPLRRIAKGSTLGWHVNRKFVSYKQIKKAILTTPRIPCAQCPQ